MINGSITYGVSYRTLETPDLANVVKQVSIPNYLKQRYADITDPADLISRGQYHDASTSRGTVSGNTTRRKLYIQKSQSPIDLTNEKIRDLLSKLSTGNKEKLFNDFRKMDISDECGQELIENIYSFAVDLTYLLPLYVEFIFILKKRTPCYSQD